MPDSVSARNAAFLAEEYRAAETAAQAGRIDQAWNHLARAHIIVDAWAPLEGFVLNGGIRLRFGGQ